MATLPKGRLVSFQISSNDRQTPSVVAMASNGTPLPTPLMSYYFKMPRNSPCVISVNKTGKAPRIYSDPLSIPKRDIESWNQAKIEKEARTIRAQHPALADSVIRPTSWEDLYRYYDPHDLWLQGAWNLWCVIDELGYQNEKMECYRQQMRAMQNLGHRFPLQPYELSMIGDFVEGWISYAENRLMLIEWDGSYDILQLFSPTDWKEGGIKGLNQTQAAFLSDELTYWHEHWRERYENPAAFFPPDQWHHLGGKYAKEDSLTEPRKRFVTPYDKPLAAPSDTLQHPLPTVLSTTQPSIKQEDYMPVHNKTTGAYSQPVAFSKPVLSFKPAPASPSVPAPPFVPAYHSLPKGHPIVVNGTMPAPHSIVVENHATSEEAKPDNATKPAGDGDAITVGTEASGPSRIPERSLEETVDRQEQQSATADPNIPQRAYSSRNKGRKNFPNPISTRPISDSTYTKCYNRDKSPGIYSGKMSAGHFVACPCGRCSTLSRTALVKQIDHLPGMTQCEKVSRFQEYFSRYGVIQQCDIKTTAKTGSCYALIRYSLESSAVAAVASADGLPLSPLSSSMRLEHPWYSKYWAPRPYTRTPPKATRETPRVTPPSRRRSPPDQGFLNRGTAQQQHGGTSSLGSPSGRKKVGQPSISPEYMRGPPPGFPPISQPQAGLKPSPPRMQPHTVGATEYNLDYHGPAHRQPCVPFHHQMAEIPEKPQNHGNLPPAHHFNQSFQQHGPPQWHHGPPHWQHAHPLPPPPPPQLPPFFGPANFVGPIPQPLYQAPPVFYNQGGPHGNAQCPVDPQMRSPQARTRQSPEQDMVGSQPLSHSSSSSSAHTTHAISQVWVVVDKAAAAEHTNKRRPVKAGTSPDEPSTPIDTVSTQEDGRVAGTLEKPVQEGESSDQGGTVVRHAQFSIHDVRFSQDMSGTVRIRPNRRNQHQALPAEWLVVDSRSATPAEQRQLSGSKKGKNKRKPSARPSSRPSTPVDFSSSQAESSKAQAWASTERPESVTENAALKVPEPKGYRADAGGSLKLSWNPRGPAIRVNHLADQMLPPPLRTGSPQVGPSTGPVLKGINSKQARFQRFDSLSSIPDCPVLPRACDLFPNYPDLSTSPPKIVMTPAETTPNEEMAPHPTINGLLNSPNRGISDSSLAQSFYTAKSTFSSRENSPPEAAKDELFVSPPETPTKTSQPSWRTLPAHSIPKLTAAAPVLEVPVETPKLDKGKSTAPLQPETSVSNLETSEPTDSKPEASKPKSSSKNKHKKKNKTRADTEAGPSSSQPQEQQQQLPTPVGSKPNSRPATPAGDANVRNQKKRQAHAKSKAERKRSAAAVSANKGGPSSSGADA